ncbi:hypothetical protein ARMGADRAFT_750252 [Armillaria gallica]|uniref:Uncharacterized protein n=1 Tax=Armillaria gallica TaxID=47427 RepID=A0A2H3DPM8_ARMGA|nr:hypothetical protein ARMGADRAFT_750252 [Armillaria gallica]
MSARSSSVGPSAAPSSLAPAISSPSSSSRRKVQDGMTSLPTSSSHSTATFGTACHYTTRPLEGVSLAI